MYATMAIVALTAGLTSGKLTPTPVWLDDYRAAQTRVSEAHKPMIVFVASGKEGWESVLRDGKLTESANKLLAEKFVCVYANTNTTRGRNLADALQVGNKGLVITDKTGQYQSYSLAGDLTGNELVRVLEQKADDKKEVKKTETVVTPAAVGNVAAAPAAGCCSTGGCGMSSGCGHSSGCGMSKGCGFFGGMSKGCGQSSGCGTTSSCGHSSGCGTSKGFCGFGSFCGFGGGHSSGCGMGGGCK